MLHSIQANLRISALREVIWTAWTTVEGCESFFAPKSRVELHPNGRYEQLFDLDAPQGSQGSEGCRILAVEAPSMLSFTWNAPPSMPDIRKQRTHVMLYLEAYGEKQTHLTLIHDGWGRNPDWQAARSYFERVWRHVVLPRLNYYLTHGAVDWNQPNAYREI